MTPPAGQDGRLAGKVAVVTGAASGFGLAIATRFVAEGATVVLVDRDEGVSAAAEEVAAGGGTASGAELDVTDEAAFDATLATVADRHGKLDVLVNNAGVIGGAWIDDEGATAHLRRNLEVNVIGVWNGCRSAIPLMRRQGGGVILNTGSTAAVVTTPGAPAYGMAKAAVVHLTRSLAAGYGSVGIRVNAVLPGPAATGIFRETDLQREDLEALYIPNIPLGRLGDPRDIAAAMTFLASDEAAFVTGAVLNVDGGYHPRLLERVPRTGG